MSDQNKKTSGHRWPKGVSGNPGGRPRGAGEVRELARQHGPEAIQRLAQLMRSRDPSVAVAACKALLDRGFGKPLQHVTGLDGPLVNITLNNGGAITDATDAARVYAEICGNPGLDITGVKISPPEAPALPAIEATTRPTIQPASIGSTPGHQAADATSNLNHREQRSE